MLPNDGKEILYVDDEETALKYFGQLFGDTFRITTISSGEDAWTYIQNNPERIAVLVTDQRMGKVSGVELMERARNRYPNIVRILITAFTQLDYAVRSVNEGGAFRYLTKPIKEEEMVGTLMRACDFHSLTSDRDRLLKEKLSVLHRLVVMDRVRGLVVAMSAMNGRIRGAWDALASYMEQSPINQRLRVQMEDIAELNLLAVAKRESQQMIETINMLLRDSVSKSSGDRPGVDVCGIVHQVAGAIKPELLEDDLDLNVRAGTECQIESDAGMLQHLIEILIRRLADVQDQPSKLDVIVTGGESTVVIEVRGFFRPLSDDQFASLFAAAIPIRKWPIGLDMDLLCAFLIVHHLGGRMRIEAEPPSGPGFHVTLPIQIPETLKQEAYAVITPDRFDTIYESLKVWEEELSEQE
ncbi:MAG: hybrid sensor histidine kinase/response regulator [Planctomycetales bacterium]|nr:hybrid sensor histidine kinase/response regulator [Planctomycetales bacterium]